jgi:hypothetical protein
MKRSLFIVVVAGITVWIGARLIAQSSKKPPGGPEFRNPFGVAVPSEGLPKTSPAQPSAKSEEFASSPALKSTTVEVINLRNQFIELSKKKALLMKEPQLKREIETLEREIPELEAWAKAEEAVRLLREVAEKYPNTKAADSANAAIRLIEQRGEPFDLGRPTDTPSRSPIFKRAPHDSDPAPFGPAPIDLRSAPNKRGNDEFKG